ncbi:MAG: ribonuclease P protein component [Proteobacteria bacterium]|nr:ribonuclease P protein component [Pseudomonadota bacterium]
MPTISNRRDFVTATNRGKRFVTGTFILICNTRSADHPAPPPARVGYTVTKKMGGAVQRNRIKRRLREAARMAAAPHTRSGNDYVFISRHKALDCPFTDLTRDMEFAFSRIHAMKDGKSSAKPPAAAEE